MTTMNKYIMYSKRYHLQEAEDGIGDGIGWLGVGWGVTLEFFSIFKFSCVGCIRRRRGMPRYFNRDGN